MQERPDQSQAPQSTAPVEDARQKPVSAAAADQRRDRPVARRFALRAVLAGAAAVVGGALFGATRPKTAEAVSGSYFSSDNTTTNYAVEAYSTNGAYGVYAYSDSCDAVYGYSYSNPLPTSHFINLAAADGVLGETTSARSASVTTPTFAGVVGLNHGTAPGVIGFNDNATSGWGVLGIASVSPGGSSYGVWGQTVSGFGVVGGANSGGVGVYGSSPNGGSGIVGSSDFGYAVYGSNTSAGTTGAAAVRGVNNGNGAGVFGTSAGGFGVQGFSGSGAGVDGTSATGIGVQGGTNSGTGVSGTAGGTGTGVSGFSSNGTGVGGGSTTGIGFGGVSTSGNGVQGQTMSGIVVEGIVPAGGTGFSGYFTGGIGAAINGNLTITGALTVTNHSYKSAAVPGKDGTLVRLYCMESPECWFEDFGFGQLNNGKVTVDLEPGFAAVVKTDSYHVFLTGHGETNGLHVTDRTPNSFTVHEGHGGTSNVSFSYRIVAKRKDVTGPRLDHVDELPAVQVQPMKMPDHPATPPTPPTSPVPPTPPALSTVATAAASGPGR
jgi:hypothetical protein